MTAPLILASNTITGGYEVANSLRFNSGSSDYLNKTTGTPTDNKICTISLWTKLSVVGNDMGVLSQHTDSNNRFQLAKLTSGALSLFQKDGGSIQISLTTNRLFRDVSAWYHIVVAIDTTQSTSSNRVKLYVNGSQETSFSVATYPSQNTTIRFNSNNQPIEFGRITASDYWNGYMAEIVFIDGSQLDPTSFGEFDEDTGIWKPIDVSGLTFGTNGFYLDFEDSSALGNDVSGNDNDFTVNNLTSIDQTTDTCTNNYCTLNPLASSSYQTLSEGNLKTVGNTSTDNGNVISTFALSKGKWYLELKNTEDTTSFGYPFFGFGNVAKLGKTATQNGSAGRTGNSDNSHGFDMNVNNASVRENGGSATDYADFSNNDIVGVAVDFDNGAFYVSKNGTYYNSGDPTSGSSKTGALVTWTPSDQDYAFGLSPYNNSVTEVNFGNPTFSITSGNSDANGYGNFEYSVPSGYYSLNTKNLSEFG